MKNAQFPADGSSPSASGLPGLSFFPRHVFCLRKNKDGHTVRIREKITRLQSKLGKNEVLSELTEEHVNLKNTWGSLKTVLWRTFLRLYQELEIEKTY